MSRRAPAARGRPPGPPIVAVLLLALAPALVSAADPAEDLARAGRSAFGEGQYASAAKSLERLVEDYPASARVPEALYLLGASLYMLDRSAEAIDRLETLRAGYRSSPLAAQAGYWLGASWLKQGKPERAVGPLRELVASPAAGSGWRQRSLLLLGIAQEQTGRPADAATSYRQLIAEGADPELLPEAIYRLAGTEYRAGRWAAARDLYAKLIATAPGSPLVRDSVFLLAESELALGNLAEAEKRYRNLLSVYPESPDRETTIWRLAEIAARSGRENQALDQLEDFLERFPRGAHRGVALRLQGDLLYGRKRYDDALASYQKALAATTEDAGRQAITLAMGLCQIALGRSEAGLGLLQQAASGPSAAETERAQLEVGSLLAALGRDAEAVQTLQAWSGRWPASPRREQGVRLLAGLLEKRGDDAAAFRRWDELVRDFPRSASAGEYLYRRGSAELRLGRLPDALDDLQRLTREFPTSPWRVEALYGIGYAYSQRGEYARAVPFFQSVADAGASGEMGLRSGLALGICQFNLGAYDKALAVFDSLRSRTKGTALEVDVALYGARSLYRLERLEEAVRRLQEAMVLAGSGPRAAEARYWLGWSLFRLNRLGESRDAFLDLARHYGADPRRAEALLRAGLCESLQGRDREAVALFDELLGIAGAAADIREQALYEQSWALSRLGDAGAAESFERLAREFPDGRLASEAFFKRASKALADGRAAEARALFRRVMADFPSSALARDARAWSGEAALAAGDPEGALDDLWGYLSRYPQGGMVSSALDCFGRALAATAVSAARDYERRAATPGALATGIAARVRIVCAARLLGVDAREALAIVSSVQATPLDEQASAEAALLAGQAYAALKDYAKALVALEGLASSRPDRIGAEARLEHARVLEATGSTAEALEEYLSVPYLFPDLPDQSARGLYEAARVARLRGERDRARAIEDKLRQEFPDSPLARERPAAQ